MPTVFSIIIVSNDCLLNYLRSSNYVSSKQQQCYIVYTKYIIL